MLVDPANPFADLVPASDPGFTGYIPGVPKPEKPREPPSGYIWGPDGTTLIPIPGGPADKPGAGGSDDPKVREAEQKQAFHTNRLFIATNELAKSLQIDPSAGKPTWGQWAAGLLGPTARGAANSPERRQVEAAQMGILDSALTLGTGAAYTKEQLEGYREQYFPLVTDDPETIRTKQRMLRGLLISARAGAGGAAGQIDQVIEALGLNEDPVSSIPEASADPAGKLTDAAYAASGTGSDQATVDGSQIGVTEFTGEQKAAYEGFWKVNPDPTPEQLKTFLDSIGIGNVTNAADIIKNVKEGAGYSTTRINTDYRTKVEQKVKKREDQGADGPAQTLLNQGVTLSLSDETAGIGNALANVLTSPFTAESFDPLTAYGVGRDAERFRIEDAREQLGYGGTAIEFAGALASMGPGAVVTLAPREAARQAGRVGVVGGALSGFGAGEGLVESSAGAGAGALLGYGIGRYGPGALERFLPAGARTPRGMDPRLGEAAAAEGVRIRQPMIEGNRRAVNKAGRLEADPSTAAFMQQAFGETGDDIAAGVARLGRGGTAQEPQAMGETLRQAAKDIQKIDREGATAAYDAARSIQPDAMVAPASMRAKIDAKIAQLQKRPNQNREQIRELQRYRADLDNPLPLQEIRDMRTEARDNISGLNIARSSAAKRADRFMMEIIDGTKDDIARALTPEARAAWEAADAQFRDNQKVYREALKPFFGEDFDKLPAEQIFEKIKASANRNGRALAGFHRRLTAEQSRDLAATLAEGLGRRGPDEDFSAALFISQARKFSPSARETIFGPSGKASFDNLLLLSRRLQRAQSQINQSRTARPVIAALRQRASAFLTAMLTGGGALAGDMTGAGVGLAAGGAAMAAGAIRKGLSAKALMNPRVSRWMADAADVSSPHHARDLTNRLGGIIAREPAVAHELQPFYDILAKAVSPAPLSAEPQTEGKNDDR